MVTVTCEVKDRELKEQLEGLLQNVGYSIVPTSQRRPAPDYRIISIERSLKPKQIEKILKVSSRSRTQFVVFTDGESDSAQFRSIFSGHTLSLHNIGEPGASEEAIERIRDDQFLKPLLRVLQSGQGSPVYDLLQGLLHAGDKGVAIIDRSFRDIYRSDLHKKLVPERTKKRGLCWQKFDHLADRTQPCINCPTLPLFTSKPGDPLPEPSLVVRNVKGEVFCILLEVSPIKDPSRDNRVVASVENATRIDTFEKHAKEVLENALLVLLDMGFSRARVLAYNSTTRCLRGFMEISKDPAGLTGTTFQVTVIPAGRYNDQVFKTKKPLVLSTKGWHSGSFDAQILYDRFKKGSAPVWAEFPLLKGNQILGKLIVDKWSHDDSLPQQISDDELRPIKPFAHFTSNVLVNLASYKSFEESATLTWCTRDIIAKLVGANSPEEIQSSLVKGLVQKYLSDRVTSAFIRIPDMETQILRASKHGAGPHWELLASKSKSYGDSSSPSVLAYETRELFGDLVSDTEKSQLKRALTQMGVSKAKCKHYIQNLDARCSVPITFGDHTFGILAVQGGKKLLEGEFLDTLQVVCSVAGSLLHLHGRIDDLRVVKDYKKDYQSKMLRWFSHDATKTVIALRDLCIEPMKRSCSENTSALVQDADQLIDIIAAQFLAYGWLGGTRVRWEAESRVSLKSVFDPIVNMVASDASEVQFDLSKVPDIKCRIDRLKTMAIVHNLIDNAINAVREKRQQLKGYKGSSKKQTMKWKIDISASLNNNNLLISVKDNGCGFPAEAKDRIFQESMGQGLAVVEGFAKLAGGEVTCNSIPGHGATFEVSIPI